MPGCVFKVSGECFDVDMYLASYSHWKPERVFRKGELRRHTKKNAINGFSGFNLMISESEDFKIQIQDAYNFIDLHSVELKRLSFSFSKSYEEHTFPYALFPSAFVREAAKFDLSLEVGMFQKVKAYGERLKVGKQS